MNSSEKKLVRGFLDEKWKDFIQYIEAQLTEQRGYDPFAAEVSDIYNFQREDSISFVTNFVLKELPSIKHGTIS